MLSQRALVGERSLAVGAEGAPYYAAPLRRPISSAPRRLIPVMRLPSISSTMPLARLIGLSIFALTFAHETATAQETLNHYLPLEVGNEWTYQSFSLSGLGAYHELRVSRDTTVAGIPLVLLEKWDVSIDGSPYSWAGCGIGTDEYGRYSVYFVLPEGADQYACTVENHLFRVDQINNIQYPEYIEIGGTQYAVSSTGSFGSGSSQGGIFYSSNWRYGEDIGFLDKTSSRDSEIVSGVRLIHARVGEVEYGSRPFPTSTETPTLESTLSVDVYPNPFSSESRLAIQGASGPVTVDVFDAVGRRVSRAVVSEAAVVSKAGMDLPPVPDVAGVYVVRVVDAVGRVASCRITRL